MFDDPHQDQQPHEDAGVTAYVFTNEFKRNHKRMLFLLEQIALTQQKELAHMADDTAAVATLTAEVANNTSVEQSAITLLGNLSAELTANANDPAAITALATTLTNNDAALAAAITANTPAAAAPTVPPVDSSTPAGGSSTISAGDTAAS